MQDRQRTITKETTIKGKGLHTGKNVTVTFKPAPENTGIVFRRTDLPEKPLVKANPDNIIPTDKKIKRTSIKKNNAVVYMIEHILAALSGLSIDNLIVDVDSAEMPGLDGSVKIIAEALKKAGTLQQNAKKKFIEIKKPVKYQMGNKEIEVFPDTKFKIDYIPEFKRPNLINRTFSISVDDTEEFSKFFLNELAPSRTFCLAEEAIGSRFLGLGKGGNWKNTLIILKNKAFLNKMRFSDEPARHKILDLMGDLYLLGGHIKGRVVAKKCGHQLNTVFVKGVYSEYRGYSENSPA